MNADFEGNKKVGKLKSATDANLIDLVSRFLWKKGSSFPSGKKVGEKTFSDELALRNRDILLAEKNLSTLKSHLKKGIGKTM